MKIQVILIRHGGTETEIDGVQYHFKPNDKGDHVCEVQDEAHIARFLSIYGFKVYKESETRKVAMKSIPAPVKAPEKSPTIKPPTIKPPAIKLEAAKQEPEKLATDSMSETEAKRYVENVLGLSDAEDKAELIAYAKEMLGIEIHHATKLSNIIAKIINFKR